MRIIIDDNNKLMEKEISIIDNTDEAKIKNGVNYKGFDVKIKPLDIIELTYNKAIAINIDGEYTVFIHI